MAGVTLLLTLLVISKFTCIDSNVQCGEVKKAYVSMGFSPLDVPEHSVALKADDLEICPAGFSCCSRDMETQLAEHSKLVYSRSLGDAIEPAKRKLVAATEELHAFFSQQITKAHTDTDAMFTVAYAEQYTQNKHVFDKLFHSFQKFYSGEDLNISEVVHQFFKDVFVRMFSLQNSAYRFTPSYLSCVGNMMDDVKPFGTVPELLQKNLKQALVASRTLIQGLAVARNVAMTSQKISPTMACTKAHMKMNFCSHCRGLPTLKPCADYCMNVIKGCLSYHSELDRTWQRFVDAMDALSLRVSGDGSFNLEAVLSPLKDQISLAIMANQNNGNDTLMRVLDTKTGCGEPASTPIRQKRNAYNMPRSHRIPSRNRVSVRLRSLVEGIKSTLRDVKHMWSHTSLAGTICSAISATTGQRCWNGESEAKYNKPLVGDGLLANKNNPEVDVQQNRADPEIVKQIKQLQNVTSMLINATIGLGNVTWIDLQIPLPNVSTLASSEGRSVKMDGASDSVSVGLGKFSFFENFHGSGSGYGASLIDDDEDGIIYSSGWPPSLPFKPSKYNSEGSGSGLGSNKIINPDDDDQVINIASSTPLVIQANVVPTEQTHLGNEPSVLTRIDSKPQPSNNGEYKTATKAPQKSTTSDYSSSNIVYSSKSLVIISLLYAILLAS